MEKPDSEQGEPTGQLVREALDEMQQLVRLEVALARDEVTTELARAKTAGIVLGAAAALGICGLALLLVAIAAAFSTLWLAALALGGTLLFASVALGYGAWKAMPPRPLGQTKERLQSDLKQLRERVA
jgi:hypothetical protein